ncbi:MAG: lamin tail domain-containing protein [Bacteroidota bacterium]
MKNYLFVIVFALAAFTSCVKDETYMPPETEVESDIVLNEILSKGMVDAMDKDYVELYNTGDEDVDISGYLINDKADPLGGFVIPDGTIILAKGYYFVQQHEFTESISSGGEFVSLGLPDGRLIENVDCPKSMTNTDLMQGDDIELSFSRVPDGTGDWVNGTDPTPNATNGVK